MNLSLSIFSNKNCVLLLIFLDIIFSSTFAFSSETDSLKLKLSQAKTFEQQYDIHLQLGKNKWLQDPDSTLFHIDKAFELALKAKDPEKIFNALVNKGVFLNEIGKYDEAIQTFLLILDQEEISLTPAMLARTYSNIGNSYSLKNSKVKAVEWFQKAVEFIEQDDDINEKASFYGRFGNLYYLNSMFNDAITYYQKAGKLFTQIKKDQGVALTHMNTGNCYKQLFQSDSAIKHYTQALKMFRQIGNLKHNEAQCLANIGNLNLEYKRYSIAKRYLLSADSLFDLIGNSYSISLVNRDLGYLYLEMGLPDLAKPRIDKSLEIALENKYDFLEMSAKRLLWLFYEGTGDCYLTYSSFKDYVEIKDSLDWAEKNANFDQLLAEFETERKEKEIELLKRSDEINQLKIKRRTLNLYISLIGFVAALLFSFILYLTNQRRKRLNDLLISQNAEINQQKEEITSQRDEIESQRDLLQNQNHMLEQFRTHTNHSLRYAQSIQAAILPSEKVIQQISNEYFVLMKPCELVSGDFFWATSFEHYHIFCVADCTGHGVPGAFMSILGITALNDIVARHRVTNPSEILGYLRESVIEALSQNDPEQLHKDGMDIALCSFNTKTRELQYAGAGLPLWIVSEEKNGVDSGCNSNKTAYNGFSLCEIKGDIMPVGTSPRMDPFANKTISLHDINTSIFLATDGFADQYGENSKVKLGVNELKRILLENIHLGMAHQSELLSAKFDTWKGKNYQVDDVTILGIRI